MRLVHFNGNLLSAVDVETTGSDPFVHEVVQIAVVPADTNITPFTRFIAPENPDVFDPYAMRSHGIDMEWLVAYGTPRAQACEDLLDWFAKLELPFRRRLIPIAHNWPFESMMLTKLLGVTVKEELFSSVARDTMLMALHIQDRAAAQGRDVPFGKVSLGAMTEYFKIVNEKPHDAYYDCVAEIELYKALLHYEEF